MQSNQVYEIILNGLTIPATRYVGFIRNRHNIFTNESLQTVDHNKIEEFINTRPENVKAEINSEFWQAISLIHWSKDCLGPNGTAIIPIEVLNKIKLRHFNYSNKMPGIRYLTKQHIHNLRIAVSEVEEFSELDQQTQNIVLSHIVGSGEGVYKMILQMPEMIASIIKKNLYGNFMHYIELEMREKIVIDLDAKFAEIEKNRIGQIPVPIDDPANPNVDALSESEYTEDNYEYESEGENEGEGSENYEAEPLET